MYRLYDAKEGNIVIMLMGSLYTLHPSTRSCYVERHILIPSMFWGFLSILLFCFCSTYLSFIRRNK